jgi:hypothetical protein
MKLLSDRIIRRYTPPTCTLEIWARSSPLSFWSDRQLVKDLRFELHFDDPRLPEDSQAIVQGDRAQLQQLGDAVSRYVQNFLQQPSFPIPVAIETLAFPTSATETREAPATSPRVTSLNRAQATATDNVLVPLPSLPTLKPKGLLAHELSFGSLDASKSAIQLSVSQLFDLAEALEQFSTEIDLLPTLNKAQKQKTTLVWASTAAAALLAIGLTTVGVRVFQSADRHTDVVASKQDSNAQLPQPNVENVIPPVPLPPTGTPVPSPTLPPALNREALPPPPAVSEPAPPSRTASVPVVVPPSPSLPPPPVAPPAPERQTIAVVPESSTHSRMLPAPGSSAPIPSASSDSAATPIRQPNLPELPDLQSNSPAQGESAVDTLPAQTPNSAALAPSATEAPVPSQETNTLLDTIPQVAEVRQYFQARWQVPQGLNQRLEYRLVLNQEGAIARIAPLGRAANIYLDRTQMPLMGTPFVSPLEVTQEATIRLVLNPDGSVKTFLEN